MNEIEELRQRIARVEAALTRLGGTPGVQVYPDLVHLGQNTKVNGSLEVTGDLTADAGLVVTGSITLGGLAGGALWHFPAAPLVSTAWDGDAYSTTGKTLIDLSVVFSGVPAGVKAVAVRLSARDSASAATSNIFVGLSNNNTSLSFALAVSPRGLPNSYYAEQDGIVPCNANGDIYYQVQASGASTMDIILTVIGWAK